MNIKEVVRLYRVASRLNLHVPTEYIYMSYNKTSIGTDLSSNIMCPIPAALSFPLTFYLKERAILVIAARLESQRRRYSWRVKSWRIKMRNRPHTAYSMAPCVCRHLWGLVNPVHSQCCSCFFNLDTDLISPMTSTSPNLFGAQDWRSRQKCENALWRPRWACLGR
jgi:hypothetical protein